MKKEKEQNSFTELAIKQNLLLWHLSKSLLDDEKRINEALKNEGQNGELIQIWSD